MALDSDKLNGEHANGREAVTTFGHRDKLIAAPAASRGLHTDQIATEWIYDTGAAHWFLGWEYLTDDEKRSTFQCDPQSCATGGGMISTSTAVMCNVPFLGQSLCHVAKIHLLVFQRRRKSMITVLSPSTPVSQVQQLR